MKKVVVHRAGGYDRLRLEEARDPIAKAGERLVRVHAAGVNFADCVVRMGLYESAKKYVGWPITPGFEIAGKLDGTEERVFAVTRFGGYATDVVVPDDQVFTIPDGWSFAEAAAMPAVYLTAYYALFELARPREGSTVLVHSAAGGVGLALVTLARIAKLRVIGVVGRSSKIDAARAAGADAVIDKSSEDLWKRAKELAPDGYHAVFDANGPTTLKESYRHLAQTGRLVVYGFHGMLETREGRPKWLKLGLGWLKTPRFDPMDMTGQNRSVLAFNLSYLFERRELLAEAMTKILGWIDQGSIKPPPVTTFPLADVAGAHRAIESGKTVGKLVLLTR